MSIKLSLSIIAISLVSFGLFVWHYHFGPDEIFSLGFYQSLANPSSRIVTVTAGDRREQVADTLALALGWSPSQKVEFLNAPAALGESSLEGEYFPKTYLINSGTDPIAVTNTMVSAYTKAANTVKTNKKTKVVNQQTILKVASIIQREAAGPQDMKLISGIIWNRIFAGMKLQMDATLQYAAGTPSNWWPVVTPADKSINSPYNTYLHTDLPPTPISNPSLAAIAAAANPQTTSCLYYIHDRHHVIHCSSTYQGQLNNIARYY